MSFRPGTWTFIDHGNKGAVYTEVLARTSLSVIRAAFQNAITALSPADNNLLFGYDPGGRRIKQTSTSLA